MQESKRQQKISRLIQRDLGEIFQKDTKGYFSEAFITVTQVRMSADLSLAKIYLSLMMVRDKESFIQKLSEKKGLVRRLLGERIGKKIRMVPDLNFYLDDSAEYADHIEHILKNLHIPPEDPSE
ncbi:MAG: 30S ribosome-binding factor RbfA [Cyclobacteriaceae bacterium]|nr:30S ribosome-binding factor RbfA [Cyclobacteriaceae bacterium]